MQLVQAADSVFTSPRLRGEVDRRSEATAVG